MAKEVRLWEIREEEELNEIKKTKLDLEKHIEDWIEKDISIVSDNLLIIGRQVTTDFGGVIDILCLDNNGDTVIIELKRDKTPREVTAQVLDYASWIQDASNNRITEIANNYLKENGPLEKAFKEKFDEELPEALNEHHSMLIVASEIDSSTERIINYLSNNYGVAINAVTFHYFKSSEGNKFIARVFLIEPEQVDYRNKSRSNSKKKPDLTYDELEEISKSNGVGTLYKFLVDKLTPFFDQTATTRSSIVFVGKVRNKDKQNNLTIFSIIPGKSDTLHGLRFQLYIDRFAKYFNTKNENIRSILPSNVEVRQPFKDLPNALSGYFTKKEEIESFLYKLSQFKQKEN